MKVLLIDADSTIPNFALMKLATYYKKKFWAKVELKRLQIPYYPDKTRYTYNIKTEEYDFVFCSVVFEGSAEHIKGDNIMFGGTGVSPTVYLPKEIDDCEPDYSIYSKDFVNDTSIGFISRGCIRKCSFCKVHVVEGNITQVSTVGKIAKLSRTKFLDNNVLALPNVVEILNELIAKRIKCQFNQGLDIRLVTSEISLLLSKLNYFGEYIFAFDNIKYKDNIAKQLELLSWRKPFQFKFFVYIHPEMSLWETKARIIWLKRNKCLPYIMRDVSCWNSEHNQFYVDLAAYCNQVFAFKKLSFIKFLKRRHANQERIKNSYKLWRNDDRLICTRNAC